MMGGSLVAMFCNAVCPNVIVQLCNWEVQGCIFGCVALMPYSTVREITYQ